MVVEIRVPEAGESITQVELVQWLAEDGSWVDKDQEIAEIDSDKATLTINADEAGTISITVDEGTTVEPGKIIGRIDTDTEAPAGKKESATKEEPVTHTKEETIGKQPADKGKQPGDEAKDGLPEDDDGPGQQTGTREDPAGVTFSPRARKLMEDQGIHVDFEKIRPDGKRITKKDVLAAISGQFTGASGSAYHPSGQHMQQDATTQWGGSRQEAREKMSTLRKKVAERLVAVKNETAMLTTFNEADMSAIIKLRKQHQQAFVEKYGFKLGFMSFFVKAVAESIPYFPQVNGHIDGNQLVIPNYADIGMRSARQKA